MRAGSASPVARAGEGRHRQGRAPGQLRGHGPAGAAGHARVRQALDAAHAMDGEVMLAYAMNGADLPLLNGYPCAWWCRATTAPTGSSTWPTSPCWTKEFDGYWMQKAYRIPDNDCACTPMGKAPEKTVRSAATTCAASSPAWPTGPACRWARRSACAASPSTAGAASARCSSRPTAARPGAPPSWARTWGATPSANGRRTSGRNGPAPTS